MFLLFVPSNSSLTDPPLIMSPLYSDRPTVRMVTARLESDIATVFFGPVSLRVLIILLLMDFSCLLKPADLEKCTIGRKVEFIKVQ